MKNIEDNYKLIIGIDTYETLQRLGETNDEIHLIIAEEFITNDNFAGKRRRGKLEKYLKKNKLNFSSIQYCSEKFSLRDKLLACKKLHIDVMIEDKTDVAMYLAENDVKVIMIDTPNNKGVRHNNIIKVHNWSEVKKELDKLRISNTKYSNFSELNYQEIDIMTDDQKREYYEKYYRYLKKQSLNIDEVDLNKGKKAYRFIYRLLRPIIKLGYNPIYEQKENVPYQSGKIICSNHVRLSDYYLIYLGLGIEQYCAGFMAAEIKKSIGGKFFSWMRSAAFIDREDPESRKSTAKELAVRNVYGDNIIVFPEGTRKDKTEEGKEKIILPFHKGAIAMAKKTGTGIVPMAIYYGKRTRIKYGELFYVSPTDDVIQCTDKLQNIIRNMIEEMMKQDCNI